MKKPSHKKDQAKKSQKLIIWGMGIGIFILILSISSVIQNNQESEVVSRQLKGATYNLLLKDLLREVQICRGIAGKNFSGNDGEKFDIADQIKTVDERFQHLQEYDAKVKNILETTTLYELRAEWESIKENMENIAPEAMEKQITIFVGKILNFIVEISDQTNLMISNDLSVHYLVHDVVDVLPDMSENFAIMRLEGRKVLENKRITEEQIKQLSYSFSHVKHSLKEVEHGSDLLFAESPSVKKEIEPISIKFLQKSEDFLKVIEDEIFSGIFSKSPEQFFAIATDTIDHVFLLYEAETNELEQYLSNELGKLRWERLLFSLVSIISVIFLIYSLYHLYRSMKRTVDEVKVKMNRIAAGKRRVEEKFKETEHRLQEIERKFSQAILEAHEEERKRVSGELHDGIGQALYSILTLLRVIERETNEEKRRQYVQQTKDITSDAMKEVKQISRSLRPSALDDLGFIPALRSFIEDYENMYETKVTFVYEGIEGRLHPNIETALYRICQEAFTNIAKHAEATKIQVALHNEKQHLSLTIKDDGNGFNHQEEYSPGLGLYSMKERAQGAGGTFHVFSEKNEGTTIKVTVPKQYIRQESL